jgi:hypothetical protein
MTIAEYAAAEANLLASAAEVVKMNEAEDAQGLIEAAITLKKALKEFKRAVNLRGSQSGLHRPGNP